MKKFFIEVLNIYKIQIKFIFSLSFIFSLFKQFVSLYIQKNILKIDNHFNLLIKNSLIISLLILVIFLFSIIFTSVVQKYIFLSFYKKNKTINLKKSFIKILNLIPHIIFLSILNNIIIILGFSFYIIPGWILFFLLFLSKTFFLFRKISILQAINLSIKTTIQFNHKIMPIVMLYLLLLYFPYFFIKILLLNNGNNILFGFETVFLVFLDALIFPLLCIIQLVLYTKINILQKKI